MNLLRAVSLLTIATGAFGPAVAQERQGGDAADQVVGLAEVIVTATKRSENLQDVPVAVSAVSSQDLANKGVFETSDLNHSMVNLQVSSPYGQQQPNFSLRGIGVGTEYNANAASPVGVYVDEVYQAFRSSHGQQLYDLEQIEVVRGPQGTLYGRNTTGGAINFNTHKPKLEGTEGYATVGYGNFDRRTAEGAIELTPAPGKFGLRIAGTFVDSDPYMRNAFTTGNTSDPTIQALVGQPTALIGTTPFLATNIHPGGTKSWGIRGTLRYKPNDDADITLKGYAARNEGGQEVPISTGASKTSDLIFRPTTLLNGFLPAFATHFVAGTGNTVTLADAFGAFPGGAAYSNNANGYGKRDIMADSVGTAVTRSEGGVLAIDLGLGENTRLKSITGFDSGLYEQSPSTDCDASFLRLCTIGYHSTFKAFNQDLRLDFQRDRIKVILGAYYGHDRMITNNDPDFFNALTLFNRAAAVRPDYFNPAGIFSNGNVALSEFSSVLNFGNNNGAFPMPTGVYADQHFRQVRNSWAVYGEGTYAVTPTINATIGLRYTRDKNKFRDGLTTYYNDAGQAALVTVSDHVVNGSEAFYYVLPIINEAGTIMRPASTGPLPGGLSRSGSSGRLSGRVIVDWKPVDTALVYASFSRGYRAGTFNGLAYQRAQQVYFVPPETVNAYELGFKSRFFDNRVQFNGAFFYYDYKGQQGQVVDATATANLVALDGSLKGLELEFEWAVTDRLTASASLGLLDSKYDHGKGCSSLPASDSRQQVGNCVLAGSGWADVGGNPFPFAAKESLTIAADWTAVATGDHTLTLHADASYTGKFKFDAFDDYSDVPQFQLTVPIGGVTAVPLVAGRFADGGGDFWNVNARATYEYRNLAFAFWVKNLTDKTTLSYGIATENLFGNDYLVRNQPRTYGVEAMVRF